MTHPNASTPVVSVLHRARVRFRMDGQLGAWIKSAGRRESLLRLRSQLESDFSAITHDTPFGSILRLEDGQSSQFLGLTRRGANVLWARCQCAVSTCHS